MISNIHKKPGYIFREDGKALILAADHPYFGYVKGIEKTGVVLGPILEYADALMIAPGTKKHYFNRLEMPVILRVSGCASVVDVQRPVNEQEHAKWIFEQRTKKNFDETLTSYEEKFNNNTITREESAEFERMKAMLIEEDTMSKERLILNASEAKKMGASALAVSVYIGTKYEDQTLENLVEAVRQASELDIPVLGVVAVGKRLSDLESNADYLTRASRMLVEHGATFIKTYYCGEGFERIIDACPVPVVVAGGKQPKTPDQTRPTLEVAYNAIKAGASGLDFGRRVWQHKNPVAIIQALREIVHHKATADEAYSKYRELVADEVRA